MKHLSRLLAFAAPLALAAPALAQQRLPAHQPDQQQAVEPSLEVQFQDPPNSARPRVWWHWMNGNVTKDGIAKDFAWMKRVGIGGMQNFDANLMTPKVVKDRLVYMTPEWKDAFKFATSEADRLGMELTIASSPGWSETGGPWVPAEDGLKKLVWSETAVMGGKRFTGKLAAPPAVTGPFGSLAKDEGGLNAVLGGEKPRPPKQHYGEVRVLAVPVAGATQLTPVAVKDGAGKALDVAGLADGDLAKGIDIARGDAANNPRVMLDYGRRVTARSLSLYAPGAAMMFVGALYSPRLEASDNGTDWRTVVDFETGQVPVTYAFPATTARYFRVEFFQKKGLGLDMGAPAPGVAMDFNFVENMSKMFAGKPLTIGDLRLSADARVDRSETKAGFMLVKDYYALTNPADNAVGVAPSSVIDLTNRMKPDGSLDWTPPKGNWRVLRFGHSLLGTENHPATPEATGLEVDKFDGPAVRRYLEHYIGMYKDASGGLLGKRGVQGILTDSIEVGAANWTPKMIEQFQRLRGYDPTPWMPALAGVLIGSREDSDKFLYDYRRTLADLMASEHYGTVAKVAHEHGLKVYGEALEDKRPSLGDDMAMRRHADIPMAAMWTHARKDGPKKTYIADIKGAASVAHIYGQNLVAAESLTASMNPWNYSPNDLKRVIDLEFVHGVNRPVIHTSVHQPLDDKFPGFSLFIFGQYFNRHESWAEMAKPWVDYMSRNSLMLQQGRNVADVAYFYGEEAPLTGLYGEKLVEDASVSRAYDFVNFDALMALKNDGAEVVTPGGARYRAIYLGGSSSKMSLSALYKINELVSNGATVIGKPPVGVPGLETTLPTSGDGATIGFISNPLGKSAKSGNSLPAGQPKSSATLVQHGLFEVGRAALWGSAEANSVAQIGKGQVIASNDIEAALTQIGVAPDFDYTGSMDRGEIPFIHRKLEDGDSYFLVNRSGKAQTIEARFRVTGKAPEIWRAETGKAEPVGYMIRDGMTKVNLEFGVDESFHVVFRKPALADSLAIKQLVPVSLARLDGPWQVTFQPGRSAPASVTLPQLAPLNEHADPGIKYFSGEATYTRDFTAPRSWKPGQPLWLDLGEVKELAEVSVNGKAAGSVWHAPFRLDIGSVTKPGRNRLSVKVANLWVNRLIGDAQKDAKKITFTTMPTYRADAPLRPSGLIGPVTLLGQK